MQVLFVGLGGFCGAIARHLLSLLLKHLSGSVVAGTLAANLLGCLCIGCLMVLSEHARLTPAWQRLLITGLLGSLTTFSTFSHETLALLQRGRTGMGLSYAGISLVMGLAMVAIGRWAAAALWARP